MHDNFSPWLEHYDRNVPASLSYRNAPLSDILEDAARRHPERTAIAFNNWRISYRGLRRRAGRFAAGLRALGVRRGDRVAIMLPNLPQTLISYWGALFAGASVVFVNPLYMETELTHILEDSGAKVLVVLDLLWARHRGLIAGSGVERIVVTRVSGCLGFPLNLLYRAKAWRDGKLPRLDVDGNRVLDWKDMFAKEPFAHGGIVPDEDVAVLQYTGGTTGQPKGAMLTHANLWANVQQSQAILHAIGVSAEVFLGVLPFFHIYGLTVTVNFATASAATIIPLPRFDPLETLKAIRRFKPTVFPGTPSIYAALLTQKALPQYDLTCVRYCVSGSAPLPVETMRRFTNLTRAAIVEGYGLTEASPITHLNPLEGTRKQGSVGIPFPDTFARILDLETGQPVRPGVPGELVLRGPQVMRGYYNRPQETRQVLKNGWLHTGDVAVMDGQGYFFIVDRKKDLILSGGYNVYPREIEEVLLTHPKVAEAAVVGQQHSTRGEVVKAFIVPSPEEEPLTREEVVAFCREKLASFKVPKVVEFCGELPKTFVGKVLKRVLREKSREEAPL